jgi:phenylpropionate dioxygenase-like ring-hydroxylating dioxygenase large terminal subunit
MPELKPGSRTGATAFPCQAKYGYIWVCLAENPIMDIPAMPYDGAAGFRQIHEYSQEWDANFLRVAENSLDVSHISYVHRQTIGDDAKPAAPRLNMFPVDNGVGFRCDLPVANRSDQQRNLRIADAETVRKMEIRWLMPSSFILHFVYPNGLVHAICGFATPIDDRRCRRMQFVYRNDSEADAPGENIAAFDRQIGAEDLRILRTIPPGFPLDPRAEAHMALDRPNLEMRRVLRDLLRAHDPNAHLAADELAAA